MQIFSLSPSGSSIYLFPTGIRLPFLPSISSSSTAPTTRVVRNKILDFCSYCFLLALSEQLQSFRIFHHTLSCPSKLPIRHGKQRREGYNAHTYRKRGWKSQVISQPPFARHGSGCNGKQQWTHSTRPILRTGRNGFSGKGERDAECTHIAREMVPQ